MDLERFKQEIRNLVAQDKLEVAIELLSEHFADHESLDDILIQAARYQSVKKQWEGGLINVDTYNQEINTLRRNILSFLRNISAIPVKEQPGPTLKMYEAEVAMSYARVVLGQFLLEKSEQDEVLNISVIFQHSKLRRRKLVVDFINELENFDLIARRQKEGVVSFHLNENGKSFLKNLLRVRQPVLLLSFHVLRQTGAALGYQTTNGILGFDMIVIKPILDQWRSHTAPEYISFHG